jgi:hypothetical protein
MNATGDQKRPMISAPAIRVTGAIAALIAHVRISDTAVSATQRITHAA